MMPAPPMLLPSMMHTVLPKSKARMAAAKPPGPQPITQTSNLSMYFSRPCHQRIYNPGLGKTFGAQKTCRAFTAWRKAPLITGVTLGQRFHRAPFLSHANRFSLGLVHERSVNAQNTAAFRPAQSEVQRFLQSPQGIDTAIRIAAVIGLTHAGHNILDPLRVGIGCGLREEQKIASRH